MSDGWDDDDSEYGERVRNRREFKQAGSALRAASKSNPRNLPCPTCHRENRLTPADRARGYQCDSCADQAEKGWC
jgi:hypothetical protein